MGLCCVGPCFGSCLDTFQERGAEEKLKQFQTFQRKQFTLGWDIFKIQTFDDILFYFEGRLVSKNRGGWVKSILSMSKCKKISSSSDGFPNVRLFQSVTVSSVRLPQFVTVS